MPSLPLFAVAKLATSSLNAMINAINATALSNIVPTAATNTAGTAVIGSTGIVTITFTGAGTATLTNSNAALSLTDTTEYTISWSSAATQFVSMKQAAAGVADTAVAGYDTYGSQVVMAGTTSGISVLNAGSWALNGANTAVHLAFESTLEVRHIQDSSKLTRIRNSLDSIASIGTGESVETLQMNIRTKAAAWDGAAFTASGAGVLIVKSRAKT